MTCHCVVCEADNLFVPPPSSLEETISREILTNLVRRDFRTLRLIEFDPVNAPGVFVGRELAVTGLRGRFINGRAPWLGDVPVDRVGDRWHGVHEADAITHVRWYTENEGDRVRAGNALDPDHVIDRDIRETTLPPIDTTPHLLQEEIEANVPVIDDVGSIDDSMRWLRDITKKD